VPQALAAAIGRCLQKEPEARFPSMDAVEEAFAALEGELAGGGRAKWAWAAAGACVALLLALGVIAAVRRPARPTAATAPAPTAIAPVVAAPAPVEVQRVDVAIGSEPPGAEVYEDQVLLGVTPCVVHLPPGPHSLELALAGYRRTALPVEARPRATASARLERIERSPVAAPHAPKPSPNRKRNGTINPFE